MSAFSMANSALEYIPPVDVNGITAKSAAAKTKGVLYMYLACIQAAGKTKSRVVQNVAVQHLFLLWLKLLRSLLTSFLQLAIVCQGWSDHSCVRHLRYTFLMPDTFQRFAAICWGSQPFTAIFVLAHALSNCILLRNSTAVSCVFAHMAASCCGLRLSTTAGVLVPGILTSVSHIQVYPLSTPTSHSSAAYCQLWLSLQWSSVSVSYRNYLSVD